jgi:hypothetical protein
VSPEGTERSAQEGSESDAGEDASQPVCTEAAVEPAAVQREPAAETPAPDVASPQPGILDLQAETTAAEAVSGVDRDSVRAAAGSGGSLPVLGAPDAVLSDEADDMLDAQSQGSDGSTISI